ncbi:MAG: serpin family protein [Candidatus Kryptoniota bacterium]
MKRSHVIIILSLAVSSIVISSGCSHVTGPINGNTGQTTISANEKQVESATNVFATNLFGQVATQEQGKNFFISPLSVSMALAMTLNGGGTNSQTYSAMQQTLGLNGLTNDEINQSYQSLIAMFSTLDQNVTFNIANSIWYRNTFPVLSTFLTTDSIYYDAEVRPLDFSNPDAANTINSWVSDKTNGKIQSIINPPIDANTVMYLINALYFNGTWKYDFADTSSSRVNTFQLAGGATESDSMMIVHDTLNYYADSIFQAVELPYGKGNYSMVVLLPNTISSSANASALNQNEISSIIGGLKPQDVELTMPKFKVQYSTSLKNVLTQMGMGIAFSPGADFTRINSGGELVISDVLHKTYIAVNEKGTEAAAVTVVIMNLALDGGGHSGPYMVNVNRPFIYLIKENHDNTIMFMGVVVDPAAVSAN